MAQSKQVGHQEIEIIGNLGRDAELKHLKSGDPVLSFSVAYTNYNGETQWYRVSIFGKLAESLAQYLTKGKQVFVQGELNPRLYEGRDGETQLSLDVRARNVRLLGGRGGNGDSGNTSNGDDEEGDDFLSFD